MAAALNTITQTVKQPTGAVTTQSRLNTGGKATAQVSAHSKLNTGVSAATRSINTRSTSAQTSPINLTELESNNNTFIRNIIIIVILVGCILAAWQGLKITKAKREFENSQLEETTTEQNTNSGQSVVLDPNNANNPPPPKPVKTPPPVVDLHSGETNMESLERLKPMLRRGIRLEMPKGTKSKLGRSRFFINEKKTWYEASNFCKEYGGHLAVFANPVDLNSFCNNLQSDSSIWLGAGTSGYKNWAWVDRTEWNHEVRNTAKLAYLSADRYGILTPESPSVKKSFYIEWLDNGSNPAQLKKQLAVISETLASEKPLFPAGTVKYDEHHYLIINKPATWSKALAYAQAAGGALATPSSPYENEWLLKLVSEAIPNDAACWIGGFHKSGTSWQWVSGEPWEFAKWANNVKQTDAANNYSCALKPNTLWQIYKSKDVLPYFIIEWNKNISDDANINKKANGDNTSNDEVRALKIKCISLIKNIQTAKNESLKNNIKGFQQDIKVYLASLTREAREDNIPIVARLMEGTETLQIKSNRKINMSQKLNEIYTYRLKKQDDIEFDAMQKFEEIRISYIKRLQTIEADYKKLGQKTLSKKAASEIKKANRRKSKFDAYILSGN